MWHACLPRVYCLLEWYVLISLQTFHTEKKGLFFRSLSYVASVCHPLPLSAAYTLCTVLLLLTPLWPQLCPSSALPQYPTFRFMLHNLWLSCGLLMHSVPIALPVAKMKHSSLCFGYCHHGRPCQACVVDTLENLNFLLFSDPSCTHKMEHKHVPDMDLPRTPWCGKHLGNMLLYSWYVYVGAHGNVLDPFQLLSAKSFLITQNQPSPIQPRGNAPFEKSGTDC